ncbi:MAG TPA: hypothetical protein VN634_12065 [Candidatus Limnocylindrales bacterium]|nr:hypothetical protein [Candidatus Limnocylindrales bacterium]
MRSTLLFATTLLALIPCAASAAEFGDAFTGNDLDPASYSISKPAGFEISVTGGELVLAKLEGQGNGFVNVTSAFTIKGDFEATVVAERTTITSGTAAGLVSSHISAAGFTDIYFTGGGNLQSNFVVSPLDQRNSIPAPATTLTLRIRRIGDHLIHEYDAGAGFVVLNEATNPVLAGPVQIGVFLGEEGGQGGLAEASFDDFAVRGDVFTGPCGNGVLEQGEACDDDSPVWVSGEFCNASCEILSCGDADDSGSITVTDALHILRTSVGTKSCDVCICDVDSSGGGSPTSVSDALRVLRLSVGQAVELSCVACG